MLLLLQAAGIREPVDPIVKQKIIELSNQGVRKVSEMRRHLEAFVKSELLLGGQALEKTRRRFYPTNKDIYNHMYKARVAHQFSTLDQKNVDALIAQCKKESPTDAFFYRPHSGDPEATENASESCRNDEEDITPDEVPDPVPSASEDQTLLFCHQTVEQSDLLRKYGDQMCLMDATYRTTKYALPLYFLCVRTNVRYKVVGSFVIQYENASSIEEALNVFKKWNPNWNPAYFMVDFAEEEIQSLERVFPGKGFLVNRKVTDTLHTTQLRIALILIRLQHFHTYEHHTCILSHSQVSVQQNFSQFQWLQYLGTVEPPLRGRWTRKSVP